MYDLSLRQEIVCFPHREDRLNFSPELGDALRKTAGMKGLSLVRTCESSLTYSLDNLDVKKHLGVTHSADPKLTCNRLLFLGSVALLEGVILNNPGMLPGKLPSNPGGMMMGMGGGGPPAMFGGNKKFGGGGGDFIAVQWNGPVKHSKPAVLVAGIQEFKREWGDKLEQGKLISFVWEQLEKMLNSVPGAGMVINRGDLEFLRRDCSHWESRSRGIRICGERFILGSLGLTKDERSLRGQEISTVEPR